MTPEYIEDLANYFDPEKLWKLPCMQQLDLPPEKRMQLDAGIALRRHAAHIRRLRDLLAEGKSLLITPLSKNGIASDSVKTPRSHERLREARKGTTAAAALQNSSQENGNG